MKIPAIQRVLLTGYLLFFLNFGPSFHRAPIFGLHNHGHDQATCHCSGTHCFEKPASNQTTYVEKQLCECQLCKFFQIHDAFQIDYSIEIGKQRNLATNYFELPCKLTAKVANAARGPPVI